MIKVSHSASTIPQLIRGNGNNCQAAQQSFSIHRHINIYLFLHHVAVHDREKSGDDENATHKQQIALP